MNPEDPQQWIAQFEERIKAVAASAEKADQALRAVGGSATSPEGDVTVRVNASGATVDIVLRPGIRAMEPEQLARLILATGQKAQREVGTQVVSTMQEFMGEGPALDYVKQNLPGGYAGDGRETPVELKADTRPDDEYFDNPPDVVG